MDNTITPGIWRHFKGKEYSVLGVAYPRDQRDLADGLMFGWAVHSETREKMNVCLFADGSFGVSGRQSKEPLVLYRPNYGEWQLTGRPLSMWSDPIDRDGYSGPRFVRVDGESDG